MGTRIALAAVLLVALCCATAIATPTTTSAALSPAQTVRAYVGAINAKDGGRLCSLLLPAEADGLSRWLTAFSSTPAKPLKQAVPCKIAGKFIGSGCCRDSAPIWKHATIVSLGAPKPYGHGLVSLEAKIRHAYERRSPETETTSFWLIRDKGRWAVVRRSSALSYAMFSDADINADIAPATREPRASDVEIPPATFTCSDEYWAVDDHDATDERPGASWLDIQHVALARTPAFCLTVKLAAPPLPNTVFDVSFQWNGGGRGMTGSYFLISPDGRVDFPRYGGTTVAGADYGMLDATTLEIRFTDIGDEPPETATVMAHPASESEPLIHAQPPIFGGDRAGK